MTVRETIFGSESEKELFRSIKSQWGGMFTVYPQIPFLQVFDLCSLDLREKEADFLKKTSIDYTLCTKMDKPLLCIEFDGLAHGFSKNGRYVEILPTKKAPYRKLKMDLKLRVAELERFPFYVISYDEKNPINEEIHLTIVDGIIGQTLKHFEIPRLVQEWMDSEEASLEGLPEYARHERIQDMVIEAEVTAEFNWDPIAQLSLELGGQLIKKGLHIVEMSEFLADPELPEFDLVTGKGFEDRLKAWNSVMRWGCRYTLQTAFGDIVEIAWVRNLEGSGVSPMTIARNIAELLTLNRAIKLASIQG